MALVVAFSVGAIGAAFANDYEPALPPFPDPHFLDPQLKVTPSDDLVTGQIVQVTGRNFGANTVGGTLRECTTDLTRCDTQTVPFTTGSNGEFNPLGAPFTPNDPTTVPVPFTVKATFLTASLQTVNCTTATCVILASRTDVFGTVSAAHHLTFAPVSSTSTTSAPTTTTTTTVPSTTSTTSPSTTTSTSTSTSTSTTSTTVAGTTTTTSAPTSTSTTVGPTATTIAPASTACAQLLAAKSSFNANVTRVEAVAGSSFFATLERIRLLGNAQLDQQLAPCGPQAGS